MIKAVHHPALPFTRLPKWTLQLLDQRATKHGAVHVHTVTPPNCKIWQLFPDEHLVYPLIVCTPQFFYSSHFSALVIYPFFFNKPLVIIFTVIVYISTPAYHSCPCRAFLTLAFKLWKGIWRYWLDYVYSTFLEWGLSQFFAFCSTRRYSSPMSTSPLGHLCGSNIHLHHPHWQ